jgi:signal transduction histidine kinase
MTDAPTSPLAALHLLVSMLGEGEIAAPGASFYDRLAEAVCRLGAMRRAAVYLSDDARRRVWAAGAHGIALDRLADAGPVADVPAFALRALEQDAVLEAGPGEVARALGPGEVARLGLTDITCIPMSAGGRHYGVVLAERGHGAADGAPPLSDADRDGLWTLGKVCALAASARAATRQQERARHLGDRLDLARDVHERVIQRLFGVTLALGAPGDLTPPQRERCADELQAATEELRLTIQRPLAHRNDASAADAPTLRDEVARLAAEHREVAFSVDWPEAIDVPAALDPLAQTVVAEAVRNARKHARPRAIDVTVVQDGAVLAIDVANDGVGPDAPAGAGVGLRLAAFEALEFGAAVDFGRVPPDRWHVRLVLPLPTTNGAP